MAPLQLWGLGHHFPINPQLIWEVALVGRCFCFSEIFLLQESGFKLELLSRALGEGRVLVLVFWSQVFYVMGPQGKLRASDHSPEVVQRQNAGHTIHVCTPRFFINKYALHTYGELAPLDPFKGRNYVFYCLGSATQGFLDQKAHNALNCLQQYVK